MPDDTHDLAREMRERGAEPVTLRFRPDGASTVQRHAAYRLPPDHEDSNRLDRLFHGRHFSDRAGTNALRYANACAVQRLYEAAGLGRSKGVAAWGATAIGRSGAGGYGPEDELRHLIETGGVGMQAVLMLVRGDAVLPYMWARARRHLDTLDGVAARWDGESWGCE